LCRRCLTNPILQKMTMPDLISSSKSYQDLLARLKSQIRTAQVGASLAVNHELVLLYREIGKEILTRQREEGWGTKDVHRLAKDLRLEFPEMQGFAPRNLGYIKAFAEAWPEKSICNRLLQNCRGATIYGSSNWCGMRKSGCGTSSKPFTTGWSRNVLVTQIQSGLYRRQ